MYPLDNNSLTKNGQFLSILIFLSDLYQSITFTAAAAALNTTEKTEKVGGSGGESPGNSSLGISDYGLWPHPPGTSNGFPFPYPFFWPSKRPPAPFTPFHSSLLGNYWVISSV